LWSAAVENNVKLENGSGAEFPFFKGIFRSSISHKLRSNKNSLFDQNIDASVGELSFDIGDFFFSQTGGWVNANMAVLIFECLGGCFDPCFGTEPLLKQAEFREVVCPRI